MTTNIAPDLRQLSDHELLASIHDAVRNERSATARLIAILAELDTRRLYLGEGCSSLFTYCTQVLHLSEHAAYNRIESARAARRFPIILDLVESGAVTLTAVRLLAPHLRDGNHRELLERARHKTKREVEFLIATINPHPDAPSVVRKLPTPVIAQQRPIESPPPTADAPPSSAVSETVMPLPPVPRPTEVKPLTPERYKIQVTVSRETYDKLRRAQDLLRHSVPNGDPAVIFERALRVLVADLERTKTGTAQRPRVASYANPASRRIPASIRREVWRRDGGRCRFIGAHGRCTETGFLEYHHVVPFASGGETSAANLELRCRAHNQYEADLWFGVERTPYAREDRLVFSRDLHHDPHAEERRCGARPRLTGHPHPHHGHRPAARHRHPDHRRHGRAPRNHDCRAGSEQQR
jgi:5-methylcytosine-specific restriction endonuclease McrA